ncbi:MAG: efflux RND transporter periplasmic adaptor subunit, partial [Flammeovirgaceae bacterium]
MRQLTWLVFLFLIGACKRHEATHTVEAIAKPEIKDNGELIVFLDHHQTEQFQTISAKNENVTARFSAPAHVMATVVQSADNAAQNLILFDNADLSYNYASYLQHLVLINQWKINIARVKDLLAHGAATGKDLIEAQTQLANEEAVIIEHETKLKLGGFDPVALRGAKAKTVWVLCNVPENQVDKVKEGSRCSVHFNSFPNEVMSARVEAVGDVVDAITRMVKVRIILSNPDSRIKAGMYANVDFGVAEGSFISVPHGSIVTVGGKSYVFLKMSEQEYRRVLITTGQNVDDNAIVLTGLKEGDQ